MRSSVWFNKFSYRRIFLDDIKLTWKSALRVTPFKMELFPVEMVSYYRDKKEIQSFSQYQNYYVLWIYKKNETIQQEVSLNIIKLLSKTKTMPSTYEQASTPELVEQIASHSCNQLLCCYLIDLCYESCVCVL